jgi:murein L,D-transpeptidase YafK
MFARPLKLTLFLAWALSFSASVAAMSFLPGCASSRVQENAALSNKRSRFADKIVVKKSQRRLYLMRDDKPFRTYKISLGGNPVGHKRYQGDNRTPEGRYTIDWRKPNSQFYKALHISYPSWKDRLAAEKRGWHPGGAIMIHGEPPVRGGDRDLHDLIRKQDWTQGCIAVSNMAIDEIWGYTIDGTPIEILP